MNQIKSLLVAFVVMLVGALQPAMAVTECTYNVGGIWTGDGGTVNIYPATPGPNFYVVASDANTKNILAMASLARSLGTTITVRFTADGVSCTTSVSRGDVVGMWSNSY